VPTRYGPFRFRAYRDNATGSEHLALVSGDPASFGAVVRVHSECLTGEVFSSHTCECGPTVDNTAFDLRVAEGAA
jgi:3,4-dihydroxy 2-butanone 4-phosphate synthase/GTP cyclohydrolase II